MSNPLADLIPTGTSVVYAQPLTDHTVAHRPRWWPAPNGEREIPVAEQFAAARCQPDPTASMAAVTAHRAYDLGLSPCTACFPTA